MRVLKNIVFMLGLLLLAVIFGSVINSFNPPAPGTSGAVSTLCWGLVLGSAVGAAFISNKLEFRKYKTGMSYHPVSIFLVHVLFWAVAFPWFLTVRDKIKDGSAELKDEFKNEAPLFASGNQQSHAQKAPMPSPVPPPLPPRPGAGSIHVPPPPMPPARPTQAAPDRFEQLQKLADLKNQGILTEEEFQSEKMKVLG